MTTRITDTDRIIIQHLRANARMSNAELAELAHLSESQCSRRLRELERTEIIQQYIAVVNLIAVDLPIRGVIEIRLSDPTKLRMEAFERAMSEMPSITDCWHTSGEPNYSLGASVSDPPSYSQVLDELAGITGVTILRSSLVLKNVKPVNQRSPLPKSHAARGSRAVVPRGRSHRASIARTANAPAELVRKRLDDIDHRILGILSTNARISNVELSRQVGLSSAPCLRRVQALEKAGVIKAYTTIVDSDALNQVITNVRVRFDYENNELRRSFEQRLLDTPEILVVLRTEGDSHYLLVVESSSLRGLERLLMDSLLSCQGVKTLQSFIRLRNCFPHTSRLRGLVSVTDDL